MKENASEGSLFFYNYTTCIFISLIALYMTVHIERKIDKISNPTYKVYYVYDIIRSANHNDTIPTGTIYIPLK
jgi:hypothetical protein